MATALARILIADSDEMLFQRRDHLTSVYPGLLTFFGGKIEEGEDALEACIREVTEETSLVPGDLMDVCVLASNASVRLMDGRTVVINWFSMRVARQPIKVFEGAGAEMYTFDGVLARSDLAEVARLLLTGVFQEGTP